MAEGTRSWREIRAERALNEQEMQAYGRLMVAQALVAAYAAKIGIEDGRIAEALSASEPEGAGTERRLDPSLEALSRFVAALGGRLELRAVFDDGAVVLMRDGELVEGDGAEAHAGPD